MIIVSTKTFILKKILNALYLNDSTTNSFFFLKLQGVLMSAPLYCGNDLSDKRMMDEIFSRRTHLLLHFCGFKLQGVLMSAPLYCGNDLSDKRMMDGIFSRRTHLLLHFFGFLKGVLMSAPLYCGNDLSDKRMME